MTSRTTRGFAIALTLALAASSALAVAEKYRVTDRAKVYQGFPDAFSAPAVVDSAKVLETLPAMKKIREEKVLKDSAKWHLLINEANQHFQRVLKTVSKEGSYDLIAEVGYVTGTRAVPNVTDAAIAAAARS